MLLCLYFHVLSSDALATLFRPCYNGVVACLYLPGTGPVSSRASQHFICAASKISAPLFLFGPTGRVDISFPRFISGRNKEHRRPAPSLGTGRRCRNREGRGGMRPGGYGRDSIFSTARERVKSGRGGFPVRLVPPSSVAARGHGIEGLEKSAFGRVPSGRAPPVSALAAGDNPLISGCVHTSRQRTRRLARTTDFGQVRAVPKLLMFSRMPFKP